MVLEAERIFNEYMRGAGDDGSESRYIVGVSGGADSICLLFLLRDFLPEGHLRVIHINHMIRGLDADQDSLFVKDICEKEGFLFKEIKRDVPLYAEENSLTEEEAGRRLRYEAFEEEALKWEEEEGLPEGSVHIAVAHHLEDTAETFLFNLFRGSGIAGLGGIPSESGRIVRPLLRVTRADIEDYLREKNIDYRTDATNNDLSYSRNRIRKAIIPEAEKICPSSALHISLAAQKLQRINDYLKAQVDEAEEKTVRKTDDSINIEKDAFLNLPEVISSMLVLRLLTGMTPMKKDIGETHVKAVLSLISGAIGGHADLPYGIIADMGREELTLRRNTSDKTDNADNRGGISINRIPAVFTKIIPKKQLTFDKEKEIFNPSDPEGDYTKYFDYDKISSIAVEHGIMSQPAYEIRHRKEGDYLVIKKESGDFGRKTLSNFLTDLKLTKEEKDSLWVLSVGKEVFWVIGYRMSDSAKIDNETENILEIRVSLNDESLYW